jgi:phosphoglycerate dehydrogenase-like enzyme
MAFGGNAMSRLRVLVTVPQPLRGHILTPETLAKLESFADVTMNEDGRNWSAEELADKVPGFEVMIASWGLPRLTEKVLVGADKLRLIAYAAGSVKGFITDEVFQRGIAVSHAAARIAESVAELALLLAMMGLRRPQDFDRRMKAGEEWPKSRGLPLFEIAGTKVGLLGMRPAAL